jgi:hypothetical protein
MKKLKLSVVTLSIICRSEDAETIRRELEECDRGQGLYSLGTDIRETTNREVKEVYDQVPEEFLQ